VSEQVRDETPVDFGHATPPVVLVVTEEWSRLTDRALSFAVRLSPDVIAIHLVALAGPESETKEAALQKQWSRFVEEPARAAGLHPPRLLLLQAQYRRMHEPLLKLTENVAKQYPGRPIAILIPELVKQSWWQYLLHTHRGRHLRRMLLRYGGPGVVVINVPWYLEPPQVQEVFVEPDTPAIVAGS
jgi:hypothetical protein